jgi:hypothetical protein
MCDSKTGFLVVFIGFLRGVTDVTDGSIYNSSKEEEEYNSAREGNDASGGTNVSRKNVTKTSVTV